LPVYRIPVGQRQAVYAFKHEIDEWMVGASPGSLELAAALEVAGARPEWNPHKAAEAAYAPASATAEKANSPRLAFSIRFAIGCAIAGLVLASLYAGVRAMSSRQIVFTSFTQVTTDSIGKEDLLTDGHNLFFTENRNGRVVLSKVSAEGGAIRFISTPFVKIQLQSISSDGKELLLEAWEGQEWERNLWVLPSQGGEPTRVGQVLVAERAGNCLQLRERNLPYGFPRNSPETVGELYLYAGEPPMVAGRTAAAFHAA
jgi:hypothetical protein